jgi:integrase
MSFQQAQDAARHWYADLSLADSTGGSLKPYTVKDAAQDWLDNWKGTERGKLTSEANVNYHIVPELGHIEIRKLTFEQVEKWLKELATKEPIKLQQHREAIIAKNLPLSRQSKRVYDPNDSETLRKRRDTANRVFTDLRSLLNRAYKRGKIESRAAWERVDRLKDAAQPKREYLRQDEAKAFVAACPKDFRNLVYVALATGARYGELCSLPVSAFDLKQKTVTIKQSKTGTLKHVALTDREAKFFSALTHGRRRDEFMLLRDDGEQWGKSHQQHRMEAVLKAAKIKRPVRFHDLRHTLASLLIQNGASIEVIANQLGHSSTAVTVKHYAHLSPDYIGKAVRASKPQFLVVAAS